MKKLIVIILVLIVIVVGVFYLKNHSGDGVLGDKVLTPPALPE